jgi:hypothetical protein
MEPEMEIFEEDDEVEELIVKDRTRAQRRAFARKAKNYGVRKRPIRTRNEREACRVLCFDGLRQDHLWTGSEHIFDMLPEKGVRQMMRKIRIHLGHGYFFYRSGLSKRLRSRGNVLNDDVPDVLSYEEEEVDREWSAFEAEKAEEERQALKVKERQVDLCWEEHTEA